MRRIRIPVALAALIVLAGCTFGKGGKTSRFLSGSGTRATNFSLDNLDGERRAMVVDRRRICGHRPGGWGRGFPADVYGLHGCAEYHDQLLL